MSGGFIPTVVSETGPVAESVIINDGWFPDIDPAALRKARRIRDSVTAERLRDSILGAMITVGNQLATWQIARIAAGTVDLAGVAAPTIDGTSRLVVLYHRAIGAYAKAELVEAYRDVDVTTAGQRNVDDLEPSVGELRRDAVHAVRDMIGVGRTNIELI